MKNRTWKRQCAGAVVAGGLCAAAGVADAGVVLNVQRIAYVGQVVTHNKVDTTLTSMNAPFVNGNGQVGFTGGASPGGSYVWFDDGIVWVNTDDTVNVVTGTEGTMGISNAGGFIYSPSINGNDAVYSNEGPLLAELDAIPNSGGNFSTFNSRPTMLPNGTAYWVGGYAASSGGAQLGRMLLRCTDVADVNTTSVILQTGDNISGSVITASGVGFGYDVSDNDAHVLIRVIFTPAVDAVLVDEAIVASDSTVSPNGNNWETFGTTSVNNAGQYVFSGNTAGAAATDELLMVGTSVGVAEGTALDGVTLTGGAVRDAYINNGGGVLHIWGVTGGDEHAFYGNAANLGCTSRRVLSTGDLVDFTGDGVADASVTDFEVSNAISLSDSLGDNQQVFVEVTLTETGGGATYEAIIAFPALGNCPANIVNPVAMGGSGDVNIDDLLAVIGAWGPCGSPYPGCAADVAPNCAVDIDDLLAVIGAWGPCP